MSKVSVPTSKSKRLKERTLYIAGHTGLMGRSLVSHFSSLPGWRLITATRKELELTRQELVEKFLNRARPDAVVIAAGRVGGIEANAAHPAEFIYENLMIEANLIHGARKAGVGTLLNFGSSCMFPKACPQPMRVEHLMTGRMEPTSAPYAMAKWAGLTLCASYNRQYGTRYLTVIPCTLFGPGDSFDPKESHVISALIRKLHEAKAQGAEQVTLWGSGEPRREFLYAEDMSRACQQLLTLAIADDSPILVGSGVSYSIRVIAEKIARIVEFRGEIRWDSSKPDGAPEKLLDSSLIREWGWMARVTLEEGMKRTYRWFLDHETKLPVTMAARERVCASS